MPTAVERAARPLVEQLRALRGGRIDYDDVSTHTKELVAGNLAGLCRELVVWADTRVADRRAADAFVRFWGLGQLPETRDQIAATLRSVGGRRRVSAKLVDVLVAPVIRQLDAELDRFERPSRWAVELPHRWVDPYPEVPSDQAARAEFDRVRYLAWADIAECGCAYPAERALLLYEQEHQLRDAIIDVQHREHRRRLRHLAWAMLWTARQRRAAIEPTDSMADRLLGPRQLAVIDRTPPTVGSILALTDSGSDTLDELIDVADFVRREVLAGRPGERELYGLVRDVVARLPPERVPLSLSTMLLSLEAVRSREQLRPAGLAPGWMAIEAGLDAADDHGRRRRRRGDFDVHFAGIRAGVEVVALATEFGDQRGALRAARAIHRLGTAPIIADTPWGPAVSTSGCLQAMASGFRHLAIAREDGAWLDVAERAAGESLDVAVDGGAPAAHQLLAANQCTATALARLQYLTPRDDHRRWRRQRDVVELHIAAAHRLTAAFDDDSRPHHSAKLTVARHRWKLAVLDRDRDAALAAERQVDALLGWWTLPMHLRPLSALRAATRRLADD